MTRSCSLTCLPTRQLSAGLGLLFVFLAASAAAEPPAGATAENLRQPEQDACQDDSRPQEETVDTDVQAGPRALSRAFRVAARKATPSVVTILSYGQEQVLRSRRAQREREDDEEADESTTEVDENQLTGIGSGVIISTDGQIITNNHVITGAKRVVVQLADETELPGVDVRGDPESDVATLRIEREEGCESAEMGNSDELEIGDWVLTIGSPFRLEATVSAGIISAKNRSLARIKRGRLIQTDAAINPGNSGGPMIDLDGSVVAISTAIATRNGGYQGIGFAIPINQAKWIARELAEHGRVRRAAIGIRMAELNVKIARKFDLPPRLGVLAYQVIEDSAAARAGIQPLDVILEFAGQRVRDPGSLQEAVERKPVGSVQEIKIYRGGEEITLEIELATVEDPTQQESKDDAKESAQEESVSESAS